MKYKITKRAWEDIGKTAGWIQNEMEDVLSPNEELNKEFKSPTHPTAESILSNYSLGNIVRAIKSLGEESIAGFSGVGEEDVSDILNSSEPYVLGEIKNWLQNRSF